MANWMSWPCQILYIFLCGSQPPEHDQNTRVYPADQFLIQAHPIFRRDRPGTEHLAHGFWWAKDEAEDAALTQSLKTCTSIRIWGLMSTQCWTKNTLEQWVLPQEQELLGEFLWLKSFCSCVKGVAKLLHVAGDMGVDHEPAQGDRAKLQPSHQRLWCRI